MQKEWSYNRAEQRFRFTAVENFLRRTVADYFFIEQYDLVGIFCHQRQIVRYEYNRHIFLFPQLGKYIVKQFQTVMVNARYRLVQQKQIRHGV